MTTIRSTYLAVFALLLSPMAANAGSITIGQLSSNDDGSTEVITDSLNALDWLRWDVLNDLTYAQTLATTAAGGAYEGWQLAGINEAYQFLDALLSGTTNGCATSDTAFTPCNSSLSEADTASLLGDSFSVGSDNVAWFLSDNGSGMEAGYLRQMGALGIYAYNEFDSIARTDTFAAGGSEETRPIGWLLYRDTVSVPVPEPGTLALFGIGLAGMGLVRRRKKA